MDRATARRWALEHGLGHSRPKDRTRASVRRWQSQQVGELWQLDACSHRWLGPDRESFPLLDMVDDCSRVITGASVYPRECQLAYLDFLCRAFEEYGLPLQLYVDHHSMFFTHVPDTLTYLGECLLFYGISFRYAPTPQAKGKVERQHQFWQNRLPSYCLAENIQDLTVLNSHIQELRIHHNQHETHRELNLTPEVALDPGETAETLRLASQACVPMVALYLERTHTGSRRSGRTGCGGHSTPAHCTSRVLSGHAL